MSKRSFKQHLARSFLSVVAALAFLGMAAYGQEEGSAPPPTPVTGQTSADTPPVEQALVPEGVFAVHLVEALKMGQAQDEAQAESLLSGIGIEPKNGWIAEYPVTPVVIGEIQKAMATTADAAKLGMSKEQALKALSDLTAKLGLNVTPGPIPPTAPSGKPASTVIYKYIDKEGGVHYTNGFESVPKEYRDQAKIVGKTIRPVGGSAGEGTAAPENLYAANPNPEVINNYYYVEGPPVVTYYPPPDPYYYLYSWVPYPFWSTGFFFSGFFILHDFHRHVFFNRQRFFVTNHVVDGVSKRMFVLDPVNRTLPGRSAPNGVASSQLFNSPRVQSSARTIVTLNRNRFNSIRVPVAPRMSGLTPPSPLRRSAGPMRANPSPLNGRVSLPHGNFVPPPVSGGRTFSPPTFNGKFFVPSPPRVLNPPSFPQGRGFGAAPPVGGNSFGGFPRGGGSMRGFHGGGGFGGHGGSSGGGSRGGHR